MKDQPLSNTIFLAVKALVCKSIKQSKLIKLNTQYMTAQSPRKPWKHKNSCKTSQNAIEQQELKLIYDTSDINISPQPQRAFLSLIVFS